MALITIVLYHPETQTILQTQPVETRFENLVHAVIDAGKLAPPGEGLRGIFLAPEYLFTRQNLSGGSEPRQLEYEEVLVLRERLAKMSGEMTNILFVPGSMAWRKELSVKKGSSAKDSDLANKRRLRYVDRILQYESYDPGAFEKASLLTDATHSAKNTAECYYNGKMIFRYSKLADFHEVIGSPGGVVHIPGIEPGRFTCAGFTFGMSICADQNWKGGKEVPPLQMTKTAVDFHILLSAWIAPDIDTVNLNSKGYLLSCSSKKEMNKVVRADGKEMKLIPQSSDLVYTAISVAT